MRRWLLAMLLTLGAVVVISAGIAACGDDGSTSEDDRSGDSATSDVLDPPRSKDGTSSTADVGPIVEDAGDAEAGPPPDAGRCNGNQQIAPFLPFDCQSCLETKCCAELVDCFTVGGGGGGTLDCNGYHDCVQACDETPDADGCYGQLCDPDAAPGVDEAYAAIQTCGSTSCAATCD